jgi:hypothetical protein
MSTSATTIERLVRRPPSLFSAPARRLAAACCAAACALLAPRPAFSEATNAPPDRVVSRFRIGPLFEYRATRDGGVFWALRPLVSHLSDPATDTAVTDLAWPLGTRHRLHEEAWWRFGLAYGSDSDVTRDDSAWKAALFPLYFQGRSRAGEDYWALFPLYGHLPHVLFMEDIDFALFPLYLNYEINRVGREYYLWPVFSRTEGAAGAKQAGVFPLYGRTRRGDAEHLYAFWPFWTSAVYDGPRNAGTSWMLFPVAAHVDRAREQQWMWLPPFFSHARTDSAERWRLPWPLYESEVSKDSTRRSVWPLYGSLESGDERRWYAAWPLIQSFTLTTPGRRTERSRFFPFYLSQQIYRRDAGGGERLAEEYTRCWPLYARESDERGTRVRALELMPIRFSGGIERNWSAFWTLYEREEAAGEVSHDALWGLLKYKRERKDAP